MDRGFNIYGPRGLHALMEHNPSANDYFRTLPGEVQDRILRHDGMIGTEDSLHAVANHYMKAH